MANLVSTLQNKIDSLQQKIKIIQEGCEHTFELTVYPNLRESLVKGTYIGELSGPTLPTSLANKFPPTGVKKQCSQCNFFWETSILRTCPNCLSDVKQKGMVNGLFGKTSREYYLGCDYIYYGIMMYACTGKNCSFRAIRDEWDQ